MSDLGYCPTCKAPGVRRRGSEVLCLVGHVHTVEAFNPPAPPRPRENSIEDYFVSAVVRSGGVVRKVTWPGQPGAPDRLAGWPNERHGLVELKRPKGVAEAHQVREHRRLREIGFRVDVIDTKEGVDAYVREMTNATG